MLTYTAAQARAAEEFWLTRQPAGAEPGILMRRAAQVIASAVVTRAQTPVPGRRVVLLVGAGNNGGDALVAGALLRRRGMAVTAILSAPDRAHAAGLRALRRAGGRVMIGETGAGSARWRRLVADADAIIDGLVGLGGRPPLRPPADILVDAANDAHGWRLAIDLSSGIDPDTGNQAGAAFRADRTITFGAMKTGLMLSRACGEVQVAEIGMSPADCDPAIAPDAAVITDADVDRLLPQPGAEDNKFSLGVTGVVAGSRRYVGAALLSVGGAVRLRPGLVRYVGAHAADVVRRYPEVVAATDLAEAGRVQAWVVGPGMGTDGAALGMLRDVLAADVPVLVDADGLTMLANAPLLLADRGRRNMTTVLTPHAGEFARLFPDLDPTGAAGRVAAVRVAAQRSGAVVLLKGDRTVVAAPDGRAFINATGAPFLATAGSGDVLSGMAGAVLSAGVPGLEAAAVAAHLHGRAGERAATAGRPGASALLDLIHVSASGRP